jgi:hypothetical protein
LGDRRESPVVMSETPEEFFGERDFELRFTTDEGFVWADLIRRESGAVLPKYGRGTDERSAAVRAVERWRQEQG